MIDWRRRMSEVCRHTFLCLYASVVKVLTATWLYELCLLATVRYNSGVLVHRLSFTNTEEGVEWLRGDASEAALTQLARR